jgi:SAM-dependent methyltransferase
MIVKLKHDVSPGLAEENLVHAKSVAGLNHDNMQARWPTVDDYLEGFAQSSDACHLDNLITDLQPNDSMRPVQILEVGAGMGRPTVYLASRAPVFLTAVEPSAELCELLEMLAEVYGLAVQVVQGTGESIDQLGPASYDACFFHASLHHCDDPQLALRHAYQVLRPGGMLFVLNEPHLPFFRSKAWFEQQLLAGRMVCGDYGGNEHSYHTNDYLTMLRNAGFGDILMSPLDRYRQPARYLEELRLAGAPWHARLIRTAFYRGISALSVLGLVKPIKPKIGLRSLLQWNYRAIKPT